MPDQSFETRYRSYVDLLSTSTPTMTELDAITRQLGRLNDEVDQAAIVPERQPVLHELKEETGLALGAALHRARIDDASAVAEAIGANG
ncbi:hypothetical protein [Streptomyces sp. NPDC058664]|uniref:hypothetical protein n=1 Tax=Streptomyces sp. NPDC058664 TaxID=3346585 RepID=UPI003649DD8E